MHYDKIKPIVDSIQETLTKIGEPLTDTQVLVIAPAIMIWMNKYLAEAESKHGKSK